MKKKKRKEKRKLNDSFGVFADVSINHHHHKSTAKAFAQHCNSLLCEYKKDPRNTSTLSAWS